MNTKISDLISVILPTFNREAFLVPCIDCILNSDYNKIEIIIVNDGSTDNTLSVLSQYKSYSNIKIINFEQNSGSVCIPRNVGISYSQGEFIAHADDDVITHKRKFNVLHDLLLKTPTSPLAYGNRRERWLNGNTKDATIIKNWNPNIGAGIDNGQILYRSSVYKQIPFIWRYRACDFYLSKEIYNNIGPFTWTSETISTYIWHESNRSLTTGHLYPTPEAQIIPDAIVKKFEHLINKEYFSCFI